MNKHDILPNRRILVTGACGLIGTALKSALRASGFHVVGLDKRGRGAEAGDILSDDDLRRAADRCVGIVHLAAVSRVIDGERDPAACWRTNVEGTSNVLRAAEASDSRPWLIYASSREVYGQPTVLPASEDTAYAPVNIYGESKVAAERLVAASPVRSAIVRFSNVYGWTDDHADRVVPAFARAAADGLALRVDGADHTFDFSHVDDVARGVVAVARQLDAGGALPPIQFVTGVPTTLGELARLTVALAGSKSRIGDGPRRAYDVANFWGDPRRAEALLGWRPEVNLRDGVSRLIHAFRALGVTS